MAGWESTSMDGQQTNGRMVLQRKWRNDATPFNGWMSLGNVLRLPEYVRTSSHKSRSNKPGCKAQERVYTNSVHAMFLHGCQHICMQILHLYTNLYLPYLQPCTKLGSSWTQVNMLQYYCAHSYRLLLVFYIRMFMARNYAYQKIMYW